MTYYSAVLGCSSGVVVYLGYVDSRIVCSGWYRDIGSCGLFRICGLKNSMQWVVQGQCVVQGWYDCGWCRGSVTVGVTVGCK